MNVKALATSLTATLIGCAAPMGAAPPQVAAVDADGTPTHVVVVAETMSPMTAMDATTELAVDKSDADDALSNDATPLDMTAETPSKGDGVDAMAARTEAPQDSKVQRTRKLRRPRRQVLKEQPSSCGCGTCGPC